MEALSKIIERHQFELNSMIEKIESKDSDLNRMGSDGLLFLFCQVTAEYCEMRSNPNLEFMTTEEQDQVLEELRGLRNIGDEIWQIVYKEYNKNRTNPCYDEGFIEFGKAFYGGEHTKDKMLSHIDKHNNQTEKAISEMERYVKKVEYDFKHSKFSDIFKKQDFSWKIPLKTRGKYAQQIGEAKALMKYCIEPAAKLYEKDSFWSDLKDKSEALLKKIEIAEKEERMGLNSDLTPRGFMLTGDIGCDKSYYFTNKKDGLTMTCAISNFSKKLADKAKTEKMDLALKLEKGVGLISCSNGIVSKIDRTGNDFDIMCQVLKNTAQALVYSACGYIQKINSVIDIAEIFKDKGALETLASDKVIGKIEERAGDLSLTYKSRKRDFEVKFAYPGAEITMANDVKLKISKKNVELSLPSGQTFTAEDFSKLPPEAMMTILKINSMSVDKSTMDLLNYEEKAMQAMKLQLIQSITNLCVDSAKMLTNGNVLDVNKLVKEAVKMTYIFDKDFEYCPTVSDCMKRNIENVSNVIEQNNPLNVKAREALAEYCIENKMRTFLLKKDCRVKRVVGEAVINCNLKDIQPGDFVIVPAKRMEDANNKNVKEVERALDVIDVNIDNDGRDIHIATKASLCSTVNFSKELEKQLEMKRDFVQIQGAVIIEDVVKNYTDEVEDIEYDEVDFRETLQ